MSDEVANVRNVARRMEEMLELSIQKLKVKKDNYMHGGVTDTDPRLYSRNGYGSATILYGLRSAPMQKVWLRIRN